jgi:hypothetical protein
MLHVDWRAGGIGGGSRCNTMPPKPLEGDFLFVPPLLFVGHVVWRAIFVAAACVVVDEPSAGCSCSRRRRTTAL